MIGAGGAVPGNGSRELTVPEVEEKKGAAFGGDHVEERGEELPLQGFNVSRSQCGADFEKSGRVRASGRLGAEPREIRLQVGEIVGLELLGGETQGGVLVQLDGAAFGGCGDFGKKRKEESPMESGSRRRERVRR